MATATPYTPPTFTKARSSLANAVRRKASAPELAEHRADLAAAKLVKAVDAAVDAGVLIGDDRAEYVAAYVLHRLGTTGGA